MENTKKKCEDYKPCNIKDKDGYCMNNDRSCIWREGAIDTSERQLTIPDVSSMLVANGMPAFGTKEFNDMCSNFFGGKPKSN